MLMSKGMRPADVTTSNRPREYERTAALDVLPTTKRTTSQSKIEGTPKRPDRNAEARIQADVLEWLRLVASELLVFHCPNGGYRNRREAARLKWQGVLPGVPDLVIVGRDGRVWFFEIKTAGSYLSAEQRAFADRCTALRIPFAVVRSIDDARAALATWGVSTREAR